MRSSVDLPAPLVPTSPILAPVRRAPHLSLQLFVLELYGRLGCDEVRGPDPAAGPHHGAERRERVFRSPLLHVQLVE